MSIALFQCVCVTRGTFCLARSSIPNRRDEDKGTQEEVEQKLMSVSAVQCVSSWLGEPMNKSKFLSFFLLPCFFSLSLPFSIALLCSRRIAQGWSDLFSWLSLSQISWQTCTDNTLVLCALTRRARLCHISSFCFSDELHCLFLKIKQSNEAQRLCFYQCLQAGRGYFSVP